MPQDITRRFLLAVATLIGVSWLICFIRRIISGDVAIAMLGDDANPDTVAALRRPMGLRDPWYVQYGRWIGNKVSGSIDTKTYGKNTMPNMAKASWLFCTFDAVALRHGRNRYATRPNTRACDLLAETWPPQHPPLLRGLYSTTGVRHILGGSHTY